MLRYVLLASTLFAVMLVGMMEGAGTPTLGSARSEAATDSQSGPIGPAEIAPTGGSPGRPDAGGDTAGQSANAEKIALGQKLFFDGRLSADGTVACAVATIPHAHSPMAGRPRSVSMAASANGTRRLF